MARSLIKSCGTPSGPVFRRARVSVRPVEGARAHAQSSGHCHVRPPRADWPPARELQGDWLERSGRWLRLAERGCVGSAAVGKRAGGSRRPPPLTGPGPPSATDPGPSGAAPLSWPEAGGSRRAWSLGGPAPRPPEPARSPSRMEVLDEFDSEFSQSVTFCQLISEEDFERQAATYTERALRRLFRSIDRNPALAERVVRKGKLAEYEGRGLLSFLWAKFFCAVQGELNCCNSMGALEMHQRLEQLKRSIHRVHLYSQDAKKKRRKPKLKKPEPILLQDRSTSPCLPPTVLPPPPLPSTATTVASMVASSPPVYTMPRVFGPFPPLPSKSMEKLEVTRSEVKLNWAGLSSNRKSHMVDLTPLVLNPGGFHFSYLAGNSAHQLHCPGYPWVS
ncbi:uncharacterized protein LOC131490474 isoform X3 [Neofelis nebulosa]|uniref:uncharacterized protein LOC131490474 isoform X3 n=1 Tax=Neofelis nebulosa TaxID=61452 RepID=UPI00272AAEC0|nr:uncharacterized protein LOC131490474 isoform X3 [Neofelis nebulosa]